LTAEQSWPGRNRLLSRLELAKLMRVHRATITTWAARHADFPQPVISGDAEYYWLGDVARWGEMRPVPGSELSPGEASGCTYGQRLRREAVSIRIVRPSEAEADQETQQRLVDELLGPGWDAMRRGSGSDAGYTALLMCLVFLRCCACKEWRELDTIIRAESVNLQPEKLLRRIGDLGDEALRECGVVPGARYAIERLRPQSTRHIIEIIRRCGQLGTHAFIRLLDLFAADSRLGAADSYTPREVALLMARLVAADAVPELPIYDPYLRGGELLRAAREVRHPADRVPLHGDGPNPHTQPFVGMSIVLHDDRAVEIRRGSRTPWDVEKRKIAAGAVLLNPPFNMLVGAALPDTAWPFGVPPADKSDFAWLQHAVTCLAPGARAAVLMPKHAGASSDQEQRNIRENMVEKGSVQAIVMLPGRLFPASSANVNLWVVGPAGGSPGRVLFIDATRMLNRSKTGPVLASGAAEQIAALYREGHRLALGERRQLANGGRAITAGVDDIRSAGYSLDPADYLAGETRAYPGVSPEPGTSWVHESMGALSEQMTEAHRIDAEVERLMSAAQPRSLARSWAQVPLAAICELKAGPSFTRLGLKERTENGTVPVVMPRHLRDRRIATTEMDKVSEQTACKLDKFWLATGDILCIRSGAITEPAIAEEQHAGWLYGTNLIRLRIKHPSQVDASYLLGFLSLPEVQEWIRGQSTRTATSSISTESLGNLMVTCPPVEMQRQISAAFNTFDAHIAIHRQIIEGSAVTRAKLGGSLIEGTLTIR
jgi:type I restriction enzyme M protein